MTSALLGAALALILFVLTQSLLKFVIEPIQDQRKLIGEAAYAIVFYANVSVDTDWRTFLEGKGNLESRMQNVLETQTALRALSGKLRSTLWSIPFYSLFAKLRIVPKPADLISASSALIGWSNSLVNKRASDLVRERQDEVLANLRIERKLRKIQG